MANSKNPIDCSFFTAVPQELSGYTRRNLPLQW
jgi:hypothetical protein